ncbi:MAG: cyanophycin synthetase, partial [Pseudomonadota bacterium]
QHAGVAPAASLAALERFAGVKRRLELRGIVNGVSVYDDFAHHPTAIAYTLDAVRDEYPDRRLIAVLEPRSNTMRMGHHRDTLAGALAGADEVWLRQPPGLDWDLSAVVDEVGAKARLVESVDRLAGLVAAGRREGDQVIIMSNGGFGGLHDKLLAALAATAGEA